MEWEQSEETRRTATQLNLSALSQVPAIATTLNAEAKRKMQLGNRCRAVRFYYYRGISRSQVRVGKFN